MQQVSPQSILSDKMWYFSILPWVCRLYFFYYFYYEVTTVCLTEPCQRACHPQEDLKGKITVSVTVCALSIVHVLHHWLSVRACVRVQLEGEGTYECSLTGLVFEAAERVLVRYSVLSWSKFSSFLRDSWKFAGPIFNVDTVNKDASVLKSIQFPHSLCLAGENGRRSHSFLSPVFSDSNNLLASQAALVEIENPLVPFYCHTDPENEMTFSVLHIKDNRPLIEPTADHTGSHVKWNVTSLSPVGPIIQTSRPVEHHGVVLVYKQLGSDNNNNNFSFHVYLATNSSSDINVSAGTRLKKCLRANGKMDFLPLPYLSVLSLVVYFIF